MCDTSGNDPDPVASLREPYADNAPENLTDNVRSNFSVISPLIHFMQGHAIRKDLHGIGKIKPVLFEIDLIFCRIPFILHT